MSVMQAVAQFLQFVPLEGELHDFFHPVTNQILNLIKGTNCLPSDPSSSLQQYSFTKLIIPTSDRSFNLREVVWKQPSQLLFVKEKFNFIREHIPQALLQTSLNLSYLHSSLLPFINPALQLQLGIGNITVDHLIEIAQAIMKLYSEPPDMTTDSISTHSGDSDSDSEASSDEDIVCQTVKEPKHSRKALVRWIANWLACVHMVMEDSNDVGAETIEKLKKFVILPLEGGGMASTGEASLFFPPDDAGI